MRKVFFFILKYFHALLSCVYLFGFGFLLSRNRDLLLQISNYFGVSNCSLKCLLPKIKISEVFDSNLAIRLDELSVKEGNIALIELACIANITRRINPLKVFEIGTFDGRSTLNIALNCAEEARVYTLDLPENFSSKTAFPLEPAEKNYILKEKTGHRLLGKTSAKKIIQLYGDSGTFDFSSFFGSIDLVFIDGSHSFENAAHDTQTALKLLRSKESVIIWHDYGGSWEGVIKALNKAYSEGDPLFKRLRHVENTSLAGLNISIPVPRP